MEAFLCKNKRIYTCKSCRKNCEVDVDSRAFKILGLSEIIAVIIFLASIFIGGGFCLAGILFITLVFMGAYSLTPFMVRLFRMRSKSETEDDVFNSTKKESGQDTDTEIYSN